MSTLATSLPPVVLGRADNATELANSLGRVYEIGGKLFRLVRMSASLSAAATKVIVTAVSAGAPTWLCTTTTTANDWLAAGVIPTGQKGSDGTTALASGDYLLIQISGSCDVMSGGAIAAGGLVGTSTTAGKADDATVAAGVGAFGVALEAAAGADEATGILLKGLV